MSKRPSSVTIIAWFFMSMGVVGLAYHATEFRPQHPFESDLVWAAVVRLLAVLGGAFVLRGSTWARWLLLVWLAFHVALSAVHSLSELAIHAALLVVVSWFLFRPEASAYFRRTRGESSQMP